MHRWVLGAAASVIVTLILGACGGVKVDPSADLHAPPYAHAAQGLTCGRALAKLMAQRFISPASSVAERIQARRTLDLIAADATTQPVCGGRAVP